MDASGLIILRPTIGGSILLSRGFIDVRLDSQELSNVLFNMMEYFRIVRAVLEVLVFKKMEN